VPNKVKPALAGTHVPAHSRSSHVTIMHCNIQGLTQRLKLDCFNVFLSTLSPIPKVLCLTEHWFGEQNMFLLDKISGFKVIANFPRKRFIRGGACVLVEDQLAAEPLQSLNAFSEEGIFECASVIIKSAQPIIVICIYRPPKKDRVSFNKFYSILDLLLRKAFMKFKFTKVCIAGDFNIDLLTDDCFKSDFLNILNCYNLHPNFLTPTRITPTSKTCLDNIFSNFKPHSCKTVATGLSDHFGNLVTTDFEIPNNVPDVPLSKRCFSEDNIQNFLSELLSQEWDSILNNELNINDAYKMFLGKVRRALFSAFPVKSFKKSPSRKGPKSWITNGLRISSVRKRQLHELSKGHNDPNFLAYVRKYKSIFKKCVKAAKIKNNNDYISKSSNKVKAVWEVVAKESGGKVGSRKEVDKICINGFLITDKQKIANTLNDHFCNVTRNLNLKPKILDALELVPDRVMPEDTFTCFPLVTEREVSLVIQTLEPKKSAGWDEVSPFLLKKCSHLLTKPLTYLINRSLQLGIVPDLLKISIVKAIPKKGNTSNLDNLRPISLLSVFSKLFEKIVFGRLCDYFDRNNLFSKFQFGFRKGKSTADAIFEFVEQVAGAVDGSQYAVGAFCDLSKAFDSVNTDVLIAKLSGYGVAGTALGWIQSFLVGRQQKVVVNSYSESRFLKVKSGVPQGSILGPFLFLVFCNDLPDITSRDKILMYADDTSIVASNKSKSDLSQTLAQTLENMSLWCDVNGLKLNPSKTKFINFHLNHSKTPQSDSSYLPAHFDCVVSTKFLGLEIDSTLSWHHHVTSLLPKLSKSFYALLSLSQSVDLNVQRQVYFAHFHSLISYGLLFWGNSTEAVSIFKMQKRVIRLLANLGPRHTCRQHFRKLHILPLPCLLILQSLIFVRSNSDKFFRNNHQHKYSTRNLSTLQYPIHRTTFLEKSPSYFCLKIYNKCPSHIRDEPSPTKFKKLLIEYLFKYCFYSLSEYMQCNTRTACLPPLK
jgi:hypothetical protein